MRAIFKAAQAGLVIAGLLITVSALAQDFVPMDADGRASFIVRYAEPGLLARHRQVHGQQAFRLDSSAAQQILADLQSIHNQHLATIGEALGRTVSPSHFYLASFSGMAMKLRPDEARTVSGLPQVASVRRARLQQISTYRGPTFIGADQIWNGSAVPGGGGLEGRDQVAAILDTGIPAAAHDAFADDPACGHGVSGAPGKVLSSLDCASTDGSGLCNGPSPGDTNGHGSHTSSTVAGNRLDASASPSPTIPGSFTEMSGVAPCARIRAYKVCPTNTCPDPAILAGMQSVLLHGDVDVMNFSISGGTLPWQDNDRTKLDLVDAGVFVAASAGNTSFSVPDPVGQVNHRGPWVMSVAASTRDTNNSGSAAQGDVLASFSFRGPTPSPLHNLQKPNITAPGVNIYAAVPGGYAFISGTSMSGPHVAGAALLVAQAHPDWTPSEIKSAIEMTAFQGGFKENGTTPWTWDDVGSGRVDLSQAALAGLVMDISTADFLAADPGAAGDVRTLNLASLRDLDCTPSCTFTRTVRNALSTPSQWTVTSGPVRGGASDLLIDVTPSTFAFTGNLAETQELTITVSPLNDFTSTIAFDRIVFSEDGAQAPDHHWSVAISGVGGPEIAVNPEQLDFTLDQGQADSAPITISNTGTQTLNWSIDEANPDARSADSRGAVTFEETLDIGGFTINPTTPHQVILPAGVTNQGNVVGFRFSGTVAAIGSSDWASDMKMTITPPAGPAFEVGGFDGVITPWDFQGSGSTNPGDYSSEHADAWGAGTIDLGNWTFDFVDDWSGGTDMVWTNVQVTLIKEAILCEDVADISWLSVDQASGTTAAGDDSAVQVQVDASGLAPGAHAAQICVNSDAVNAAKVAVPVSLQVNQGAGPNDAIVNGTIISQGYCDAQPAPMDGVEVVVTGTSGSISAFSNASGDYFLVIDQGEGPVNLAVNPAGHLAQSVENLDLVAGETFTNDFDLILNAPCASLSANAVEVSLEADSTAAAQLDVDNNGAGSLEWSIVFDDQVPTRGPGGTQVIADGGFEGGTPNADWAEASTNFPSPICSAASCGGVGGGTGPHTGTFWTWFGGSANAVETGSVTQEVTLPAGIAAELSFYLEIPVADEPGTMSVSLGGQNLFTVSEADSATYSSYQLVSLDVTSFADGGTYTLEFASTTQDDVAEAVTNFFVDDVSLIVSPQPGACEQPSALGWVSADPASGGIPGYQSESVSLNFDSAGLGEGAHAGAICVETNDVNEPLIIVPVILNVVDDPVFGDRFQGESLR